MCLPSQPVSFPRLCSLLSIFLIFVAVFAPLAAHSLNVGIDIGTQFFKIALVHRGRPLDIVLNTESKRKTECVIQFTPSYERFFGSRASRNAVRHPDSTLFNLKTLVGKGHDSQEAKNYTEQSGIVIVEDPYRGLLRLSIPSQKEVEFYSVVELLTMIMEHARSLIENTIKAKIPGNIDAVFTIPSFFDQTERMLIMDVAKLAKFNVVRLLHDTTAVSISFAGKRIFENQTDLIVLDMGARSTVAAVVRLKSVMKPHNRKIENFLRVRVLDSTYLTSFGGQTFDMVLSDLLASKFLEENTEVNKTAFFQSKKARVALSREAEGIKKILSTNDEANIFIEALYDDIAFQATVKRAEFEERLLIHKKTLTKPIRELIEVSEERNLTILLFGGGLRVPMVQKWLTEIPGFGQLSLNINGDEAAALGAALYGACFSPQVRVRKIRIFDNMPYEMKVGSVLVTENRLRVEWNYTVEVGDIRKYKLEDKGINLPITSREDGIIGQLYLEKPVNINVVKVLIHLFIDKNGKLNITKVIRIVKTKILLFASRETEQDQNFTYVSRIPPLSEEHSTDILRKLNEWREKEKRARDLSDAMNNLESAIYTIRDSLESERVVKLTNPEEREAVEKVRQEVSEWLESNTHGRQIDDYVNKLSLLETEFLPIKIRENEWTGLVGQINKDARFLNNTELREWVLDVEKTDTLNLTQIREVASEARANVTVVEVAEKARLIKERKEREEMLAKIRKLTEELKKNTTKAANTKKRTNVTKPIKSVNGTNITDSLDAKTFGGTVEISGQEQKDSDDKVVDESSTTFEQDNKNPDADTVKSEKSSSEADLNSNEGVKGDHQGNKSDEADEKNEF